MIVALSPFAPRKLRYFRGAKGDTGWQTVRLVDLDYANPQLREYCCREIDRIIAKLHPDGAQAS